MLEVFKELDQYFFLFLNSLHNSFWDHVMYWVTSTLFWIPLYIFLVAFMQRKLGKGAVIIFNITIILCDQISASIIRPFFQRLRPCCDPKIQHLVHLVGTYIGDYSFPSSHATNTFGIAMLCWLLLKEYNPWIYLLFPWAFLVTYGRVYGGVHYPGDIIVGALLGLLLGKMTCCIYRCSFTKK